MAPEKTTTAPNRSTSSAASSSDNQSESEEIVDKKNVTDSESEEDSEEQSDSRERTPSPTVSAFAVKPISSKPMDKPQKPTPKPSAPEQNPGTKRPAKVQNGNGNDEPKPGTKCPANVQNGNGNDGSSQNKKMKVEEEKNYRLWSEDDVVAIMNEMKVEEEKKNYRLWIEDNVVAIMKGVLDFKSKRGADAFGDMGAFYEFVKNKFTVAVTKNQLWDKARRLKKKYQAILEKIVNGEDPVFQKPVEHKCYQLSKKIWGTDSLEGSSAKNPPGRKKKATTTKPSNSLASPKPLPLASPKALPLPEKKSNGVVEDGKPVEDDFHSMFPALKGSLEAKDMNLSVPEAVVNAVKYTMPSIGTVNAKELEERWKNLGAEPPRLFLEQLDLVREQTKMALDAMESSKQ